MTRQSKNSLETILVVEDHPVVLQVVQDILEGAGFCVLTAGSGAQALEIAGALTQTIHLLLSDVMMPDMSGPAVAHLVKKQRPQMRVMLMSGYVDGDLLVLNHGWHFIEKPFLPYELVAKVTEVLHTPERSQGDDRFDDRVRG